MTAYGAFFSTRPPPLKSSFRRAGISAEFANGRRGFLLALAAAGADAVVAHHPHVPQGMTWIGRDRALPVPLVFSTGNFVFPPRKPTSPGRRRNVRGLSGSNARPHSGYRRIIGFFADPKLMHAVAASGTPAVNISGALRHSALPRVMPDQHRIGQLGAEHLLRLGLRELMFLETNRHFAHLRREGFEQTARAGGATVRTEQVEDVEAIAAVLRALPHPVGVMATHDHFARGVVDVCARRGLRVPEDVAVIGADNTPLICELSPIPLSSVDSMGEKVGYRAARVLAGMLAGEPAPAQTLVNEVRVVPRASSDSILTPDRLVARAARFIRTHAVDGIDVNAVAAHVGASRRTLERRLRLALGRTVHEEIRRVQFDRALALLAETDRKILAIAMDCGFGDLRQFLRQFRQQYGQTPGEYRQQSRGST